MANRYNELLPQQKYVETFVPLPMEQIMLMGKMQQDTHDKGIALYDEAKQPIVGGNVTKQQAAILNAKVQKDLENMYVEAEKTGNFNALQHKVKNYANALKTDPIYQGIELDRSISPEADKSIREQGFKNYVQDFYDPNTGQYNQLDPTTPFNAGVYSAVKPGDPQKEFKPYYDQLQDVIEQNYNGELSTQPNPDGSYSIIQNGERTTRSVTRDELRKIADHLAVTDPNFTTLQPFTYAEAVYNKDPKSKQDPWNKDKILDVFVNNYLKNKSNKEELQKVLRTTKGTGDGSGSGAGANEGTDNIYGDILDNIYASKPTVSADGKVVNSRGTAVVNEKQMAAIVGGEIRDGKPVVNLTGRKVYLTTPEQVTTEGKAIIDNRKAIKFQAKLVEEENKIFDRISNPQSPERGTGYIDQKTGNRYYIDPANNIHQETADGKKSIITKAQLAATQDGYKMVKLEALANGIDLDSKSTQEAIKKVTKEDPIITSFNLALEEGVLNGDYIISPAKDGDNLITDKAGNLYGRNYITLTQNQVEQIAPDNWGPGDGWKTLLEKKILKPTYTAEGVLVYQMPVTVQSDDNTDNITRNSQLSIYKDDAVTQASINRLQQVNANKQNFYKANTQAKNIEAALNTGKYKPNDLLEELSKTEDPSGVVAATVGKIKEMKDSKAKNEELVDLWLMVNNYPAWTIKNSEESGGGKSQGEWSKTPTTPLVR